LCEIRIYPDFFVLYLKAMGKCTYCGQGAGWFRSQHKECAAAHKTGIDAIATLVRNALVAGETPQQIKPEMDQHAADGRVAAPALSTAIGSGIAHALQTFLEDHSLSAEEEKRVEQYLEGLPIDPDEVQRSGLAGTIVKASLLRSISEGTIPEPRITLEGDLPFLFQKSEKLLFVFPNVEYLEQRTRTEYQGRSQGVSIRIAKGVYYRTGSFKGHPVQVSELQSQGRGIVAVTTKHLYFGSSMTSFKIPFTKIVSLQTFSDGIQIQKDGIRSRPQVFKGVDAWFVSNVIAQLV
jgi:hypothetical protein